MPQLYEKPVRHWSGKKPAPEKRLRNWIDKKATPPTHIKTRPLFYLLPKKIQEANSFYTAEVWLTASGELRLGDPDLGQIIGNI